MQKEYRDFSFDFVCHGLSSILESRDRDRDLTKS